MYYINLFRYFKFKLKCFCNKIYLPIDNFTHFDLFTYYVRTFFQMTFDKNYSKRLIVQFNVINIIQQTQSVLKIVQFFNSIAFQTKSQKYFFSTYYLPTVFTFFYRFTSFILFIRKTTYIQYK